MTSETIILAAGGTGGHLYPAEALAQELINRGHKVVIVTDKRGTAFQKLGDKVRIYIVNSATFKAGLMNKLLAVLMIGIGIIQSALLIKKLKPGIIVGFGGYPSFPTMITAQYMGISSILHEQNAVLGKANIYLAHGTSAIAASLPETRGIHPVNEFKVTVTGNPVRAAIMAVRNVPYPSMAEKFEIFITGGSTALTRIFNETVPDATRLLPKDIREKLHIVHQCRTAEQAATAERYRDAGVQAEIKSFFDDMPQRLSSCHLFIGRSGASTVAELGMVGRPAIFVPYPNHTDMQQKYNAEALRDGAWIIMQDQFTPQVLAKQLEDLIRNPEKLEKAAKAAKECGQPDAVANLAKMVEAKLHQARSQST